MRGLELGLLAGLRLVAPARATDVPSAAPLWACAHLALLDRVEMGWPDTEWGVASPWDDGDGLMACHVIEKGISGLLAAAVHLGLCARRRRRTPSVLWPRAFSLRDRGARGASRIGALLLSNWFRVLSKVEGFEADLDLVSHFVDDVVVRADAGVLWVTEWTDPETALRVGVLLARTKGASEGVVLEGRRAIVVTVGDVPEREAWLEALGVVGQPSER